jgi:peptidoglycan/xylan/chitin deacetylase (PgdA/CDA1 family)
MGTSFIPEFRRWREWGFEVSPHGYDHILWHDEAAGWDEERADRELEKIRGVYRAIFGEDPTSFAAPGWQAGEGSLKAMDGLQLLYHSDTRGERPYFPKLNGAGFKTLEIPTTLPTWDEMLAWDGINRHTLVDETWKLLQNDRLNVWTIHAEFEGTSYFPQFHEMIERAAAEKVEWVFLPDVARTLLQNRQNIPLAPIEQGSRPGRAGTLTCQHG